jgi:hypothetical protein
VRYQVHAYHAAAFSCIAHFVRLLSSFGTFGIITNVCYALVFYASTVAEDFEGKLNERLLERSYLVRLGSFG